MFSKGDLIHIPQAAVLFDENKTGFKVVDKPVLALFVKKKNSEISQIVLEGKNWFVSTNNIYLNRGSSVN